MVNNSINQFKLNQKNIKNDKSNLININRFKNYFIRNDQFISKSQLINKNNLSNCKDQLNDKTNHQFMFRKKSSSIKNSKSDLKISKDQFSKSSTHTSLNRKLVKRNSSIHLNNLKNKFNLEILLDGLDHNRKSIEILFRELYLNDDKLSDEKINSVINKKSTKETDLKKSNLNRSIYLNSLIDNTNLSKSEINLLNTSLDKSKCLPTHLNEQNLDKDHLKSIGNEYRSNKSKNQTCESNLSKSNKSIKPTNQQNSSIKEVTIIDDNFLPVQKLVQHWTNTNIDTNTEIKITVDTNNLPIRTNSIRNRRAIFEQISTDQNKENSIKSNDNLRVPYIKQRKNFWESLCNKC